MSFASVSLPFSSLQVLATWTFRTTLYSSGFPVGVASSVVPYVLEQTAIRIPLQQRRHGVRVGAINDRTLLSGSSFVLAVQADMPAETLRRNFPGTAKIGAVEQIRELVNVALPGIELRALPVAPRQMPFVAGAQYFELDRNSPHWQQMQSSGGFAIHVSGDYPNLSLDLWAIRG